MTDEKHELCAHCGENIDEQVGGLKNALGVERDARKTAERKLKEFREAGDIDEMKASIADGEEKNRQLLEQVKTLEAELETTKTELGTKSEEILDGKIGTAVAQANGNLALLRPAIREQLQKNPDANIEEMVAGMKTDDTFASAFKATTHSGGGSFPGEGGGRKESGGGAKYPTRRSQFTERQKVDFQNEFGLDALLDLPL